MEHKPESAKSQDSEERSQKDTDPFGARRLTQSEIDSLRKEMQEAGEFCIRYFKENPLI